MYPLVRKRRTTKKVDLASLMAKELKKDNDFYVRETIEK